MSLFTDLKEILTPYAQRIKDLAAADEEIKADLDALNKPQRLADGTDLDTILTPGVYMLHAANSYQNMPTSDSEHGILEVWHEVFGNNVGRTFQRVTYTYKAGRTNTEVWARSYSPLSSTWTNWISANVGLSNEAKTLILLCFAHIGEWSDSDGRKNYNALVAALSGGKTLSGITATYTSSGHTVYHWDSLDSLKPYISVNAVYADGTTETITDYILTGNLKNTSSIVTVNYMGKTANISVSVSTDSDLLYYVPSGTVIDGTNATGIDTGIKLADTNKSVTVLFDATDEEILTRGRTTNFLHALDSNDSSAGYNAILQGTENNGEYIKKYGLYGGIGNIKYSTEFPNNMHRLHGAITHEANSTSSKLYLYVDGQKTLDMTVTGATFKTTDAVMFIGKRSSGGYNWKGTINKLAVYNRVLSISEINTILGVS